MKKGISVWLDQPVLALADLAVAAEAVGMDDVWLPDHYFLRDVYVAQAVMAERTSTINLGTSVVAAQLRLPAQLASSSATIDEMSGGRAVIGIGPGGYEFASQFDLKPASPVTMMRESITIVRDLLHGRSDREGKYYTTRNAKLWWEPSPIPIYMAARGPKMLELAGEVADGVIIHGLSPAFVDYVREHLERGAKRAGRSGDDCDIMIMLDADIDDDEAAGTDRLRPRCTIMAGGTYSDDLIPVYGLDPEDVARLRARVSAGDPSAYELVTDEMVQAFAIAGSAKTLTSRLQELERIGVGRAVMKLGEGDAGSTLRQLELIKPVLKELA